MSAPTEEKPLTLKSLTHKKDNLCGGHRMCSGCGAPTVVRQVLLACDEPVVIANATGCLEVSTCLFPYTAWEVPWMHSAFENAAATASGIETMYRALRKKGKIQKNIKFIAFGGDGGTYDIGFQALSGAMERGHDMIFFCLDNEAYMNTGIQRSSATPFMAATTTSPAGQAIPGQRTQKK
ncbi:MAG: pyruvate ferredoxin oxidoreductase, partial [Nitrospirae bacterium]|nr:pyruvate ferredoxin oxidoreductase [Nitrospirota bacterium]